MIVIAANDLLSIGGHPVSVQVSILIGTLKDNDSISLFEQEKRGYNEQELKTLVRQAQASADVADIEITGIRTEVIEELNEPCITAAVIGYKEVNAGASDRTGILSKTTNVRRSDTAGIPLAVVGEVGLSGTLSRIRKDREILAKRLSQMYLNEAVSNCEGLLSLREAMSAVKEFYRNSDTESTLPETDPIQIVEGGIFAALWNFSQIHDCGLRVELKEIPIRQETVEVCNILDINPYEMYSGGAVLIAGERSEDLVKDLLERGFAAAVIGHTTGDHDRLILNGDEKRFLTP